MKLISPNTWGNFRALINSAHDTFNTKEIVWKKALNKLDRYGEDPTSITSSVTLKVLINYNYMRTWPITFTTDSGELDRQSLQLLINKDYLRGLGFINAEGYFNYNPDLDRFIIDGLVHKAFGDTPISQAYKDDLLFAIVVKREETSTGDQR